MQLPDRHRRVLGLLLMPVVLHSSIGLDVEHLEATIEIALERRCAACRAAHRPHGHEPAARNRLPQVPDVAVDRIAIEVVRSASRC